MFGQFALWMRTHSSMAALSTCIGMLYLLQGDLCHLHESMHFPCASTFCLPSCHLHPIWVLYSWNKNLHFPNMNSVWLALLECFEGLQDPKLAFWSLYLLVIVEVGIWPYWCFWLFCKNSESWVEPFWCSTYILYYCIQSSQSHWAKLGMQFLSDTST